LEYWNYEVRASKAITRLSLSRLEAENAYLVFFLQEERRKGKKKKNTSSHTRVILRYMATLDTFLGANRIARQDDEAHYV